jgi:hypothetical protein
MVEISWTDRRKYEEILKKEKKEKKYIIHKIKRNKANGIGNI